MGEPWTICHGDGCFSPVAVTLYPAEEGGGYTYTCPACEWEHTSADHANPPTALDNLAKIAPILARIADDESAPDAVRVACRKVLEAS